MIFTTKYFQWNCLTAQQISIEKNS